MPTLTILNWSCKIRSKRHGIKAQNSNEDPKPTIPSVTSIPCDSLKSMLLWLKNLFLIRNVGCGQSLWNQDAYLILKCLFWCHLAGKDCLHQHSLCSTLWCQASGEDLMLVQCSVKFAQSAYIMILGSPWLRFASLKQTRLNFKTYTNLLQNKENKFQQHLKNRNPTAISNKTPQSLLLFALKWHVLGNTAIMVDSDFN